MLTKEKQTKTLEALDKAQNILKTDEDANIDTLCALGGLISDVYDMETED